MPQKCRRRPQGGAADVSSGWLDPQHKPIDAKTLAAVERASELDRKWFERHRDRAHRVRRLIPGEPLIGIAPSLPVYVVVKQITPGARAKVAFYGTREPCQCEDCAADLWLKFAPAKFQAMAVEAAAIVLRRSS